MRDHPCEKHWGFFLAFHSRAGSERRKHCKHPVQQFCCWISFNGTVRQFQSCGKHTPACKSQALVPLSRERGTQVNLGGKCFCYDNIQEEVRNGGGDISHGRFPETGTKADYQEMVKK